MKCKFRFCKTFWVPVHHETLIQDCKDRHILKDLGNKQKNHSQHILDPPLRLKSSLGQGGLSMLQPNLQELIQEMVLN